MMTTVMTMTIDNGDFNCYTVTAFVSLPTTMTRTSMVQVLLLSSKSAMTTTTTNNNNNNNNNNHPSVEELVLGQPFNPTTTNIEWVPMIIKFDNVYKSYGPPSLWRKMTSSVPYREFALENVTITFGGGRGNRNSDNKSYVEDNTINLLIGASSSGKSTILKSILETDDETQQNNGNDNNGSIRILPLQQKDESNTARMVMMTMGSSKPILLDDRNDVNYNNNNNDKTKTLQDEWTVCVIHELEKLEEQNPSKTKTTTKKKSTQQQQQQQQQQYNLSFAKLLVKEMAVNVFDLNVNKLIIDMTPSEKYRFCLGQACIESSISRVEMNNNKDEIDDSSTSSTNQQQQQQQIHYKIPGPIILLDEYMDVETSTVIQKVQPSLHRIVSKLNGIVISVTHKPNLYSSSSTSDTSIVQKVHDDDDDNEMQQKQTQLKEEIVRRITLSAGKILSVN